MVWMGLVKLKGSFKKRGKRRLDCSDGCYKGAAGLKMKEGAMSQGMQF